MVLFKFFQGYVRYGNYMLSPYGKGHSAKSFCVHLRSNLSRLCLLLST